MYNSIDTNDNDFNEEEFNFNTFGFELQDLNESLNHFWIKNQLLIEKCKQIRVKVNRMKTSCDIAKSVGTGVSAVGGVALVSGAVLTTLSTGGLAGLLWVGGGLATAAGSITTVGTDFADSLKSKKFCSELSLLAQQRDKSAQELSAKFARFDHILNDFLSKEGFKLNINDTRFENDINSGNIITLLAKGSKNIYSFGNNSTKMFESLKEFKALNAAKSVSKVKSNSNLAQSLAKSAISLAPTEVKGVSTAIARTGGANTGKLMFRGASASLGLAITAVDVFFLVKDWNKNHPTIEVIDALIQDLEKDLQLIRKVNTFITGAYSTDKTIDEHLIHEIISSIDAINDSEFSSDTTVPKEIEINCNQNSILYHKKTL